MRRSPPRAYNHGNLYAHQRTDIVAFGPKDGGAANWRCLDGQGVVFMAAGDITFIECPYGDSFPVRKTSGRSVGIQQIVCPGCGRTFDIMLPESVERLSQERTLAV